MRFLGRRPDTNDAASRQRELDPIEIQVGGNHDRIGTNHDVADVDDGNDLRGEHFGLRATRPRYTAQSARLWRVVVYEMSSRLCGARRVGFAAAGRAVAT